MRAAAVALFASLALALSGAQAAGGAPPSDAAAPHPPAADPPLVDPDLEGLAEPLRRGIAAQRTRVESLLAEPRAAEDGRLAAAYGVLGQLYHAHDFTEAALAAYANARGLAPGAQRWAYYHGALLHSSGDLAAARAALERSLELLPEDLPSLLRLGEIALVEGRLEDAERRFGAVLALDASSAAAWFGLGRVAAERRQTALAIEAFERVLVLQPDATVAHYPLALAYRDQGDRERAQEHLARRGDRVVRSPDPLLRELVTLGKVSALQIVLAEAADPRVSERDLVGFALDQLAEVEDAPAYLEAALAQAADGSVMTAAARARVRDVVGALWAERGRLEEAERAFAAALEEDPGAADVAVRWGNLLGRRRRFEEAIARYDRALAHDRDHPEALLGRADALSLLGRYDAALADLERLDRAVPNQGRIVLRMGAVLEQLGRGSEALERFREAAAHAPTDQQAASAHAGAGRVLEASGRLGEARDAFVEAARLERTRLEHRLAAASASARLGDFAAAAAHYGAAAEADPKHEDARVGEASALLLAERWVEARTRLEGGVRRVPASATLRHLLARLLAACPDRSLRDGERALALAEELASELATPAAAETLAMALAESGQLERAAQVQERLLAGVEGSSASERQLAERLAANGELYRRGEPCCAVESAAVLLP